MSKLHIDEVKFDGSIYPRQKPNTTIINEYADALLAGDSFPPIVLEADTNRLLDGYHRWKAHQNLVAQPELNGDGVQFDSIDVDYHTVPEDIPAKLYAASLSARHGHRLTGAEIREMARELCEADEDFDVALIGRMVGRKKSSIYDYVADIKARRTEQERSIIMRLDRLGWTQQEIADVVGSDQTTVSKKLCNIPELEIFIKNRLTSGIPPLDVAEQTPLPLQLVWAIVLDERSDAERMDALGIKIQPYDVWNFAKSDDLYGHKHPGRIPGQLIAHVLYFFTEPGDTVIDPMSGSGTTQDVCLVMGRKCYGYDIDDRHERQDVITHDIAVDGWPDRLKKADLIFWDPPYFDKMDSAMIGDEGYIDGSISKLSRREYLDFFAERLTEARNTVKRGARLAFLMADWDDHTGEREGIFIWDYADIVRDAGWKLTRHIQAPLTTQQVHPGIVNNFKASKRLARLERYLLIMEAA